MASNPTLERSRLALVAVATAERVFAMIELGAAPRHARQARAILNELWDAAVNPSEGRGSHIAARVEALPRAITDAERFDDLALETLFNAALVVAGRMTESTAGLDLFSGVDHEASVQGGGPDVVFIDPRNPPPPGPYEAEEDVRMRRDLQLASSPASLSELVDVLRATSIAERKELTDRLRPLIPPPTLQQRLLSYLPQRGSRLNTDHES